MVLPGTDGALPDFICYVGKKYPQLQNLSLDLDLLHDENG